LVRLGRLDEAIDRYIRARATTRVSGIALELAQEGRYDAAMALVRDFIGRLHQGFLERADMASAYATLGSIQLEAAASRPSAARALRTQAINSYAQASNLAPLNEGYLLSYAFAQMRWGDAAGARRAFDRLLEIHPHQPDAEAALSQLASPYRRSGSGAPLR
jgi:tetratricopeptide (TPR) repeat protein